MRLFLFILLAGCAVTPAMEEGSELTILKSSPDVYQDAVLSEDAPAFEESESPSVFLPGDVNFDRPERPEVEAEEVEPDPVPTLATVQTGLWNMMSKAALCSFATMTLASGPRLTVISTMSSPVWLQLRSQPMAS